MKDAIILNIIHSLMQREQFNGEPTTQEELDACIVGENEVPKHILEKFHRTILFNQVNLEPEFADIINKNFWDLI